MFFNPETIRNDITFDGHSYRFDYEKIGDKDIQVKGTEVTVQDGKIYWWATAVNYKANAFTGNIVIRSWDKEDICPKIRKELDVHVQNSIPDEKTIKKKRESASRLAKIIYQKSKPLTFYHPYLHSKGLPLLGDERISGKKIVIPIISAKGEVVNIQSIAPNGDKKYLSGGEITGNFIGNLERIKTAEVIGIAEGWATARTAILLFKIHVVSALNAGNLVPVCENLLKICRKDARFVIFADDDSKPWKHFEEDDPRAKKNAGIEEGVKALRVFQDAGRKATMLIPVFRDKQEGDSDFNDLFVKEGAFKARQSYRVMKSE